MVREQISARGIRDERVLHALRDVPRHLFIPHGTEAYRNAYADAPQPILEGQTISQPFIVALMTEALELGGTEHILEIGAGSGYQTAILAELVDSVVAMERHGALANGAMKTLDSLGYTNVQLLIGDGSRGWPDLAPYDAILVAATVPSVPQSLIHQLKPGGHLILPIGPEDGEQRLVQITRDTSGNLRERDLGQVNFVPLIGVSGFGLPEDLGMMDF